MLAELDRIVERTEGVSGDGLRNLRYARASNKTNALGDGLSVVEPFQQILVPAASTNEEKVPALSQVGTKRVHVLWRTYILVFAFNGNCQSRVQQVSTYPPLAVASDQLDIQR